MNSGTLLCYNVIRDVLFLSGVFQLPFLHSSIPLLSGVPRSILVKFMIKASIRALGKRGLKCSSNAQGGEAKRTSLRMCRNLGQT